MLIAGVDGSLTDSEPKTGPGIATARPDGILVDDSGAELAAEIKAEYRAAKKAHAEHISRAVSKANSMNAMNILLEGSASPAALHEIAGAREAAREAVTRDRDLSDEGRQAGYDRVNAKYDAQVATIFEEFDRVHKRMSEIEVAGPGGPEWQHSFPRDNTHAISISLATQGSDRKVPTRHLRDQLDLIRRGSDIPLMSAFIANNEYLGTKAFWKNDASRLSQINATLKLAIQSPTSIARALVAEKFEGWRRALGTYQKALTNRSASDPLLDLKNKRYGPAASGRFDGYGEF